MPGLRTHLAESLEALRGVFRNVGLRRVEVAFLGSALGMNANVVVVSVYAFHHGGATAVGLVMFARRGARAPAAPSGGPLPARHARRHVMLASDVGRIVTLSAMVAAAAAG